MPYRYRFLEIYYRRGKSSHKGNQIGSRVETVVLFLPDVWSCVPTRLEWDVLRVNYKKQMLRKLRASDPETKITNGGTSSSAAVSAETTTASVSSAVNQKVHFISLLISCMV